MKNYRKEGNFELITFFWEYAFGFTMFLSKLLRLVFENNVVTK